MKTMTKWMWSAITIAAMGCGTPVEKENEKPVSFENVTFELKNVGTASIWVGTEFPLRILVGEEELLPLESCACRECPLTGEAVARPSRTEIRPGSSWTHGWNGAVIGDGSDCPDLRDRIGEELIAEFCVGTNIEGADEWSGGITDIECIRQPFTLGEVTTVAAELEHSVEFGDSIPVVLENATDAPLLAQIADNCGGSTFFSVRFGEELIERGSICGPCDCSDGGECFVACDAACQAPQVSEIPPGGSVEGSFALTYRKFYDQGAYQCTQLHSVPAGTLTATICYGTEMLDDYGEGYGTVLDPTCQDVDFTIEDNELRLVVTEPPNAP